MMMPKHKTTAALFLLTAAAANANNSGCYPAWTSGSAYSLGAKVSSSLVVNNATVTKNFECNHGETAALSHCPQYDPSIVEQANAAWIDLGECNGVAITSSPTASPTHAAWSSSNGCPDEWIDGHSYNSGELATINNVVYRCSAVPFVNAWCGNPSYKPGDSRYWGEAWTLLGSCTGTIAPSSSPVFVSIADAGGCPPVFSEDDVYEAGDKVELDGLVYQCKAWPYSAWCSRKDYEPDSVNSKDAWVLLGYCRGTMAPTSSPVFVDLIDAGGCPNPYSEDETYDEGDEVSITVNGDAGPVIVYECAASPNDAYCNSYKPGDWSKLGWTLKGYCDGTIAPTSSPVFVSLSDHNGCPETYSDSSAYEAEDKVSVELDDTYSLVYQCLSDVHLSQFCSHAAPGTIPAWTLIGRCDGTMAPTASPNFSSLVEIGDGCPLAYDEATAYQAGDLVAAFVSDSPERTMVYECRAFPDGAYCNAGPDYAPGSENDSMGWFLKGYCDGTLSPTQSPIAYAPSAKCRYYNGTQPIIIRNWSTSDLTTYTTGTRVRKGINIYKCKGYPYTLYCRMAAYEPEETLIWSSAWSKAGMCSDALCATTRPSASPTSGPSTSPTVSPTSNPSESPSSSPTS